VCRKTQEAAAVATAARQQQAQEGQQAQQQQQGEEPQGLLTLAWPLLPASSAGGASGSVRAMHDCVVVALPQGTSSCWRALPAAAAAGGAGAGAGAAGAPRDHLVLPYSWLWQYKPDQRTGTPVFMATSWAALWPVFLSAAVKNCPALGEQV
jgi:hypothetical protein